MEARDGAKVEAGWLPATEAGQRSAREKEAIDSMIVNVICEADKKGAKVVSLALVN
jgi:hypothetical protein